MSSHHGEAGRDTLCRLSACDPRNLSFDGEVWRANSMLLITTHGVKTVTGRVEPEQTVSLLTLLFTVTRRDFAQLVLLSLFFFFFFFQMEHR